MNDKWEFCLNKNCMLRTQDIRESLDFSSLFLLCNFVSIKFFEISHIWDIILWVRKGQGAFLFFMAKLQFLKNSE